jgi:EAL domain-containing protein (putative c-di-GMP-specific phosphodiesterase class I)
MIPLKKLGCGLSLDHFGRHSNHSLQLVDGLREVGLAVDYVKLDPVFIHALVSDENKQKQLQDWVNTLKAHKVKTIAGSIEDLPTLNTLMACGIEYAQGYFLQRPQSEMNYDVNGATAEHVANAAGS